MSWWFDGPASRLLSHPESTVIREWDVPGFSPEPGTERSGGSGDPGDGAEVQAESDRELAFEEGFRAGLEEGAARERDDWENARASLQTLLETLDADTASRAEVTEERVRALALAVARLLVDRELRLDPSEVIQIVRRALGVFPTEVPVRVRMNPEDLSALVQPAEGAVAPPALGRGGSIRWEADPEMGRGDVLVEAPDRILDGRVVACLERIWEELSDG